MEQDDDLTEDHVSNSHDRHKLAKMLLTAGAAWLAGHAVEAAYEAIRQRRNAPDHTDPDE